MPCRRIVAVVRQKPANRPISRVKPKNINVLGTAAVTMMMMTKTIVIRNIHADREVPNEVAIHVDGGPIRGTPETMIVIESIRTDLETGPGQDLVIGTNLLGDGLGVDLDPRRGEDTRDVSIC